MANRYWVPGSTSGSGAITDTAHWSDTNGGTNGFSQPTSVDDVYFTANSFTAASQTVTGNLTCKSVTCNGVLYVPTFNIGVNAYGNITFCSGINWTYTNQIAIYRNCTLITAGVILGSIYIQSGTNITLALADNCRLSRSLVSTGTFIFNTNNYNFTAMDIKEGGTTGQATLNLGSSIITLAGPSVDGWSINPATMTGTFKIVMGGYYNLNQNFNGYGKTFNDVEFTGFYHTITGNNTFDKLSFNPVGYTVTDSYIKIQGIQTCTDLEGRGYIVTNPLSILNNITNTSYEIKVTNNSSMQYIILTRCTNSGGGTLTINNGINGGNNVNVIFVDSLVAGGLGTSGDPYLIANAYQLNYIRNFASTKYFKQIANIDVSIEYPTWTPIKSVNNGLYFIGYYNGDSYEIQKLTAPLFEKFKGDGNYKVSNLILSSINIIATANNCGGLAKSIDSNTGTYTIVDNIAIIGTITTSYDYTGGLCGIFTNNNGANCTVKRISSNVNIVSSKTFIGGIIGYISGASPASTVNIFDCINYGSIKSTKTINTFVGGILGGTGSSLTVNLTRCINTGVITVSGSHAGGICEYYGSTLNQTDCYGLQIMVEEKVLGLSSVYRVGNGSTLTRIFGLNTCIWRKPGGDTTFSSGSNNGTNITDANAKKQATYTNYTFSATYWGIYEDFSYPYLQIYPTTPPPTGFKIYLGGKQVTKIYLGAVEITEAYLGTKTLK